MEGRRVDIRISVTRAEFVAEMTRAAQDLRVCDAGDTKRQPVAGK